MKHLLLLTVLSAVIFCAACGGSAPAGNSANSSANKTAAPTNSASSNSSTSSSTAPAAGGASAVVKDIYDKAIKRDCAAIPPMLTEHFRKEAGSSKDDLDALCDSITDSGKVTSVEAKGEKLDGDKGTVQVTLTTKDGKKEDKDENVKKENGKWVMDS